MPVELMLRVKLTSNLHSVDWGSYENWGAVACATYANGLEVAAEAAEAVGVREYIARIRLARGRENLSPAFSPESFGETLHTAKPGDMILVALVNISFARRIAPDATSLEPGEEARELVAEYLGIFLPSPSSYAHDGKHGWSGSSLRDALPLLRTHRPAHIPVPKGQDKILQQLPLALLDPILAQAEEDCAYATPTAKDTDFAVQLMFAMSESFPSEEARAEEFRKLIGKGLGIDIRPSIFKESTSNGTIEITTTQFTVMGMNVEVKLDIGEGGGDPRMQNGAFAALSMCSDACEPARAKCRCPALLLELAGPNLSLSGFAFGQYACCDQLSQMVSLLWQPRSELRLGVARLICALRRAWPAVMDFYKQVASMPKQLQPNKQLNFPYPCTFTALASGQERSFLYTKRLSDFTFLAKGQDGEQLFVKFCKSYSVNAHLALEAAGFAPKLHGCKPLPGRWLMVVTDFLDGVATWVEAMDKPGEGLRKAVKALHAKGFVHGDLRECNVLVLQQQVYIVDLEWAGLCGEARYPFFMNLADINWPDGASDDKLVTKEHDIWWMEKLLQM